MRSQNWASTKFNFLLTPLNHKSTPSGHPLPDEISIEQSEFSAAFNQTLLDQYLAAKDFDAVKKTHYFNGRYENVYLNDQQTPGLVALKASAKQRASKRLGRPIQKMGCWFNAMEPGASTTLHRHDDDDELLSGVYYVRVPANSGLLIVHTPTQKFEHLPREGQWVFFSPQRPHEVAENCSQALRLSIAFNFS